MKAPIHTLLFVFLLTLGILLSGCSTTKTMVSDSPNPGMTKIYYEIDINASKSDTWALLSNFGNLDWASSITKVHYLNDKRNQIGMARHCDLKDDAYIVERITSWTEGSGFSYVIDEASDPVTNDSYVIWKIDGDNVKSTVAFEVHYELKYGIIGDMMNALMAKRKFSTQIVEFMGELKTHLENQG